MGRKHKGHPHRAATTDSLGAYFRVLWRRPDRWVLRKRADLYAIRVFAVGSCVLLACGIQFGLKLTVLQFIPVLLTIFALAFTRGTSSVIVDFERAELVDGRDSIEFKEVESLVFSTKFRFMRSRPSDPPSGSQFFALKVTLKGDAVLLAENPKEYPLFMAGRRIAAALGVRFYDLCGQEDAMTVWTSAPEDEATSAAAPVYKAEDRTLASPSGRIEERHGTGGVEWAWQEHFRILAVMLFLAPVLIIAATFAYFVAPHWGWESESILRAAAVGVGGLTLALFVGTIPRALRHGRNTLTTDETGLCHRTFFPFRRARRVDRGLVRGVRLSTRLVLKGAWGQRPSVDSSMIAVDLLVQEGPWLRTILPAEDAIWFRDRVAEMLRL